MATAARLHVISAILAVPTEKHAFITIPAGAVIETSDDFVEPGFRPVKFDGRDLLAFTRDIRERTERVDAAMAVRRTALIRIRESKTNKTARCWCRRCRILQP